MGMMAKSSLWQGKIVFVTGFEGFLGSRLTQLLLDRGVKVIGLDIKTFRKDTILTPRDYKRMIVYKGSVADRKLVRGILRKHSISTVFHLAAEAIVCRSQENPLKAFESNITGTWEVLEACRPYRNLQAIVVASSDKAYGEHRKLPYHEDMGLIANHPYDVSKSCTDLIANTYAHTYGLPVAITRCGNIYGPGDFNFSRLIPDAMRCMIKGKVLQVRSDGRFVRDYVYVDDIANGYIKIAELFKARNLTGESFNLSDEHPMTVVEMIRNISNLSAGGLKYKILNTAKYEIKKQYLSSSKARRILGWKSGYDVEEGLERTYDWYKKYFSKKLT
jgi:CDP-glucose 4,6-dehydratase